MRGQSVTEAGHSEIVIVVVVYLVMVVSSVEVDVMGATVEFAAKGAVALLDPDTAATVKGAELVSLAYAVGWWIMTELAVPTSLAGPTVVKTGMTSVTVVG